MDEIRDDHLVAAANLRAPGAELRRDRGDMERKLLGLTHAIRELAGREVRGEPGP